MKRFAPWLVGGLFLIMAAGVLFLILNGIFGTPDDPAGDRADAALADTTRFLETIRAQDSALRQKDKVILAIDRDRDRWKRKAQVSLDTSDTEQKAVDSTVAVGVPPGVEPAVFWKDQFEAQRRVTARLRTETVPALLATINADSAGIRERDRKAEELTAQRDFARNQARYWATEFARYREDTRPGIDLGLFRVPDWTDDVVLVAAGAYGGCRAAGGCK